MVAETAEIMDDNDLWLYDCRPPLLIRGSRAILPKISSLQDKAVLLAAGIPSLPRRHEAIPTHPPIPKPEVSTAQKALVELRSLHGQKRALSLLQLQRSSSNAGLRTITKEGHKPTSSRGRKPFKSGLLKDSRNVNDNETIKHLMHQLSELNNITYKREIQGGSESFCSEITLQSRVEDIPLASGKGLRPRTTTEYPAGTEPLRQIKSHNVMKLIERQILRDLTRHIQRNAKGNDTQQSQSSPDTKTHSDEVPGELKVVIKKTKHGGKASKSGDVTKSRNNHVTLPFITKTAPANMGRRRPEKYEWSLEELSDKKPESRSPVPGMKNVAVKGQSPNRNPDPALPTTPSRKLKAHLHGDNLHSSLPRIQEEPDNNSPSKERESVTTRDMGTSITPMFAKETSPTGESPDNRKVKLPILGKSIGQHRDASAEYGGKFIKPSIGEIKRIIHGLYGDYFDFTLDRYYTYENQHGEPKVGGEPDTPLHFVTPALDDSKTPAGSHTLQLYKSAKSKRGEEGHATKSQKMPVPLMRSKYGKAIASINKTTERAASTSKLPPDRHDQSRSETRPAVDMDYLSFLRGQRNTAVPDTPNERALRSHIAYQVALYHEQIARENSSLQQSNGASSGKVANDGRYAAESKETTMTLTQFAEDIDRYALYLEAYVEAKRKQAEERKLKLLEFKRKQRDGRNDGNRLLDVVESRDAFLAQVAISKYEHQNPHTPKTPANTISVKDAAEDDIEAEYTREKRRQRQSPIHKAAETQEHREGKQQDTKTDKLAMGTKVYRIFGERKTSESNIRRWVAQAPTNYSSRLIKRQVSQNARGKRKTTALPRQRTERHSRFTKPHVMTDFVSRFRVATKYKLDRQYVASLTSGTM